jgi:hypothetical protein
MAIRHSEADHWERSSQTPWADMLDITRYFPFLILQNKKKQDVLYLVFIPELLFIYLCHFISLKSIVVSFIMNIRAIYLKMVILLTSTSAIFYLEPIKNNCELFKNKFLILLWEKYEWILNNQLLLSHHLSLRSFTFKSHWIYVSQWW